LKRSGSELVEPDELPEASSEKTSPLDSLPEDLERTAFPAIDDISFEDLQTVQIFEDMVNETSMILKANARVISDLRREYQALNDRPSCPASTFEGGYTDLLQFSQYLLIVEKDLSMQEDRVESLLRMLADRKSMVCVPPDPSGIGMH
jgi:hypothetical protein